MLVAFACYSSTEVKSFCVIKSKNTTTEREKHKYMTCIQFCDYLHFCTVCVVTEVLEEKSPCKQRGNHLN